MLSAGVGQIETADHGRIGELYLGHADAAVRLAYLLTGDRDVAEDLVQDAFVRLAGRLAHVNLIPLNPTPGSAWDASPKPVEREFVHRLSARGVAVTVRDTRGREIDGACGQLAATVSS